MSRFPLPLRTLAAAALLAAPLLPAHRTAPAPAAPPAGSAPAPSPAIGIAIPGERLDPATSFGPGIIETMDDVVRRQRTQPPPRGPLATPLRERHGTWAVPSERHTFFPHSGRHYAMNRWGDPEMGIGFGGPVDVEGAWFAGQGGEGVWAEAVRAIGFREGREVARTVWLEGIGATPRYLKMDLRGVDRIVIEARPPFRGQGWYALDDLAFVRAREGGGSERIVIDFEDAGYRAKLTGSGYRGLVWETGTGAVGLGVEIVHEPQAPPGVRDVEPTGGTLALGSGAGTSPTLLQDFEGPKVFDVGAGWLPPDTCGAVGIDHFVAVVNQNLSVYTRATGMRVVNVGLNGFWPNVLSAGDPRAIFDPHSQRFIVLATDFQTKVHIAITLTSDPTGAWYKNSIVVSQGADASRWPDYPTLGVDAQGIYTAAYMVGGGLSLFAIDKAPLLTGSPSLGTVTAWRNLPWEGDIQPCVTFGDPGREWCISRKSSSQLRLRWVQGPLTAPSLFEGGSVPVPPNSAPPNAPALGSVAPLDGLDGRPMNAVFRNGSVWMAHGIDVNGRAGVRWYEIDPMAVSTVQVGTIGDPELHFLMPSITVNASGDAVLGFTGTSANQYPGAYFAGRVASDPPGATSTPVQYRAGDGAYNTTDANGVNRWGDYSLTTVDPTDDLGFWTIQEFSRGNDEWGTWIACLETPGCIPGENYCTTSPNSVGAGAYLFANGTGSVSAQDLSFLAIGMPPGTPGLLYYGENQASVPFGEGVRCVGAGLVGFFRLGVRFADVFGDATWTIDWNAPPVASGPGAFVPGMVWNFQVWYRDPAGGPSGYNLTDAVRVSFCP